MDEETELQGEATQARRVSFGMGTYSIRRSFPRKRDSSPTTAHFRRFAEWIPAFAGMTALQMTLVLPATVFCETMGFCPTMVQL